MELKPFDKTIAESNLYPLTSTGISILQVNLGKLCNQACRHCHVDAGPGRKEVMARFLLPILFPFADPVQAPSAVREIHQN